MTAPIRAVHGLLVLAAVGVLVVVLVGLARGPQGSPGASAGTDASSGPLSVTDGGGQVVLPPKGAAPTEVVFGSLFPCTTTGEPVTITGVRVRSEGEPAALGHALRRIPARSEREHPDAARWWPTVATYGDLLAPRTARRLGGDIELGEAGFVIDDVCESPRNPEAPIVELLTTMAAGGGGAAVLEQSIDYVSEGRAHTLTVPWSYVVCGPSILDPECDPHRSAYAEG